MLMLRDFDDVVAALGGKAAVSRLVGSTPPIVYGWKLSSGTFPAKHYQIIKAELADRGKCAPLSLFSFNTPIAVLRKLEKPAA